MEKSNEIIKLITDRIQSIKDDDDYELLYNKLAEEVSEKLSLDIDSTKLVIDCLRISVENDYVTIDIFYGTIERILQTLINRGLVDDNDIKYIKDIGKDD